MINPPKTKEEARKVRYGKCAMETKRYADGTEATGTNLPALSPRQQDAQDALKHLGDIEATLGGRNGSIIKLRSLIERLGDIDVGRSVKPHRSGGGLWVGPNK